MFVHAGFWHLFFNMFSLWMFGRIMEMAWGPRRFLLFYMVCGVGAGLSQEAFQFVQLFSGMFGALAPTPDGHFLLGGARMSSGFTPWLGKFARTGFTPCAGPDAADAAHDKERS